MNRLDLEKLIKGKIGAEEQMLASGDLYPSTILARAVRLNLYCLALEKLEEISEEEEFNFTPEDYEDFIEDVGYTASLLNEDLFERVELMEFDNVISKIVF
jgi:hypothetical protein